MDTTLEMQIKTTGEQTLKILDKLNDTLTKVDTTLGKLKTSSSSIENIGKASEKTVAKVDKLSSSFSKLFTFVAAKKIGQGALKFLDDATSRAEELNLFNVIFKNIEKDGVKTFSTLGEEAYKFQNKLNEAFGTNMTETLRYQGLFQAMATNQGIDEKKAAIMSENMLKLTYDLASLYNRSEKTTAEALRAGVYAGQTKPLRGFGIDVTQTSMKPTLAALGITDRTVNEMNQAEKQILRYISTLNQARSAMGDFAQTIESPANQLKIFKQQLVEVRTAWGNLFIGIYADILPYANAILMVLKEIAKAIASVLNLETRDFNTGIGALEDTYDGFENIGTGAKNATKAAKELKRQVLGFDQINNLTTPTNTGSSGGVGSGGGLTGGIDKRLLDAISGYDNLMDKVRMKATEIRDRWMEILGFKKVINPLTGEVEWKYQGIGTTLKNIWQRFMNLNPQVRLFVGLLAGAGVVKIIGGLKKLFTALGASGLLKAIKSLFSPLQTMIGYTKVYWNLIGDTEKGTKKLGSALSEGIDAWHKSATGAEKFTVGLKGVLMSIGGLSLMKTAVDDIALSGANLINVAEGIGGAFTTIFGAIQTGAAIGGSTGAIFGGIIGAIPVVIELIQGIGFAFDEDRREYEKLKKATDEGFENMQTSLQNINDAFSQTDSTWNYYERLYGELTQIVDENGKIKKGYEERAEFITGELSRALGVEINVVDGVIDKYGDLKKSINDLIQQKKAMAKLNALEQEYNSAMANIDDATENKRKNYEKMIVAENKLKDSLADTAKQYGLTTQELFDYVAYGKESNKIKEILNDKYSDEATNLRIVHIGHQNEISDVKKTREGYEKASDTLDGYTSIISTWDKMYGLALQGRYEDINKYASHESKIIGKSLDERKNYWNTVVSDNKTNLEMLEKDRDKYSKEQYNAMKKQYQDEITLAETELSRLNLVARTKNGDLSKETIDAWKKMGEKSTDEFKAAFDELPDDVKQNLLKGLKGSGLKVVDQLQKEINQKKLTASVKTELDKTTWNKMLDMMSIKALGLDFSKYKKEAGGVFYGASWHNIPQYANGGMPNHGTLFTAGENGAEIVGNINRRTEVLNRSQIASAIYNAVATAMQNANIGGGEIHLYAHTDEGVIVDRINQKTKQTGVCPINIPA